MNVLQLTADLDFYAMENVRVPTQTAQTMGGTRSEHRAPGGSLAWPGNTLTKKLPVPRGLTEKPPLFATEGKAKPELLTLLPHSYIP